MKSKALLLGSLAAGMMSMNCGISYDEPEDGEVGSAQQALGADVWAFAWAQQSTGSFTASSSYARNSSGDFAGQGVNNTITQLDTGEYQVQFPGIGTASGGHVQVTAYGSGSERCKVDHWNSSGGDVNVFINCFTAGGAAVNTRFSVAYVRKSVGSGAGAYVWANDSTAAGYTPNLTYQFNSTGASNTIARQGVGVYAVTLPGQTASGGTVEVTAYGQGSEHCKVSGWTQSGSDTVVTVRCFNSAGALSDAQFNLNFARSTWPNGGNSYSYAWANDATAAAYTPSLSYQAGYVGGDVGDVATDITAGRTSTGRYFVNLPDMTHTGSNVQVTAYGTGSEYCKVVSWSDAGTGTQADVACFDAGGAATDSRFVIVYTDDIYIVL